jgi:hypothetical protein
VGWHVPPNWELACAGRRSTIRPEGVLRRQGVPIGAAVLLPVVGAPQGVALDPRPLAALGDRPLRRLQRPTRSPRRRGRVAKAGRCHRRLLRARRERPSGCRAAEERDKFPPPHGASHPAETSRRAEGDHIWGRRLLCITAKLTADWRLWVTPRHAAYPRWKSAIRCGAEEVGSRADIGLERSACSRTAAILRGGLERPGVATCCREQMQRTIL